MEIPYVFVTLGTDHHRFDRLVDWIDAWCELHPDVAVLVQHGSSRAPRRALAVADVSAERMGELLGCVPAVVTCGPGTIMECRLAGVRPIAVPRRSVLHEVVDDHQVAFARQLAQTGLVALAEDEVTLGAALDAVVADNARYRFVPDDDGVPAGVARVGALIDDLVWGPG